jgi:hypothetical protein
MNKSWCPVKKTIFVTKELNHQARDSRKLKKGGKLNLQGNVT